LRKGRRPEDSILVACNFTPVPREGYKVGVPAAGFWRELLNSDGKEYGGSGVGNLGGVESKNESVHGRPYSLTLTLPPLGAVFLKRA
jgi:1,4-alpha-glucan branching enzyme